MHDDRKGDVLRFANMSPKLRLHHQFVLCIMEIICFKRKFIKYALFFILTSQIAMHMQYVVFVALMCLAGANCSQPVTSTYLCRVDGIKLI